MKRKPDPLIRTMPWRASVTLAPLEDVLKRLENEGTVDAVGKQIVFSVSGRKKLNDLPAAMLGLANFHRLAREKFGIPAEYEPIEKMANKLNAGSPIFESDVDAVKRAIESCRKQIYQLRISQAADLVRTVSIADKLHARGLVG